MQRLYFIQEVCCFERAKQLIKTIPKLWYEADELMVDQEYILAFGNQDGYVIYQYSTSKPYEINQILKEI